MTLSTKEAITVAPTRTTAPVTNARSLAITKTPNPSAQPTHQPPPPPPPEPPVPSDQPTHQPPPPVPISTSTVPPSPPSPPHENNTVLCPNVGNAMMSPEWKKAADSLSYGIDESFDPCEDFYSFTCNKFLEQTDLQERGVSRFSTFDQAQLQVHTEIAAALSKVDINNNKWSETERITKAAFDSCVDHIVSEQTTESTLQLLEYISDRFGGVPFLNHTIDDDLDLFQIMGRLEVDRALGTFMSSWVSVDYKKVKQNALYISQPALPMPREYYVLPQFAPELEKRVRAVVKVMRTFAKDVVQTYELYDEMIQEAARRVVRLEQRIAMASWPDNEMRNYAQLYNSISPYKLTSIYPRIKWRSYFNALLSSTKDSLRYIYNHNVIISQPPYFAFLNSLFASKEFDEIDFVNYFIAQLLFEEADFMGGTWHIAAKEAEYVPYAQRRGFGVSRVGQQFHRRFDDESDAGLKCLDILTTYMPYGPGYVYVKSKENRDEVVKDVKSEAELVMKMYLENMLSSLPWIKNGTYARAKAKVDNMKRNYGWPKALFGDFKNFDAIDKYHKDDYSVILDIYKNDSTNFYAIMNALRKGMENREAFRFIPVGADRMNFLMSPALVNAWYQPERNSITFPYGIFNPPFYSYEFPKAFNFAGQGGTIGHELVHGFDDEGVQFDFDGSLANCTSMECGWMDDEARDGFRDMAQCVVMQYNTQCCPEKEGNVHCANGATTQGENIADLGGQQAAYIAYQEYIKESGKEEKRLPSLEKFTPNQIFWIAYGRTWCTKQTDQKLVMQLLTNPHAPSSCRTNQVVQDIPAFAKDFQCRLGQKMYPMPDQRCKVWVG